MKREMIIRAWKDPDFRARLTAEERAEVPECPSGKPLTELDDTDLNDALGGRVIRTGDNDDCVVMTPAPNCHGSHNTICLG